jgi:two-component system response regulator YesN
LRKKSIVKDLSEQDKAIINKIKNLLDLDKIYQEPNFSRADLARELNISEANVSRITMTHFGKSLPQLINELRIRDSLQLLQQTDATMSVVAEQVGFASLPTFNRVFKDVMDMAPSEYRQKKL